MNFLPKGIKLNGKYKIINYIASSEISNVYLAENKNKEKIVIKECFPYEIVIRDKNYVFTDKYKSDFQNAKNCFLKEKYILEKIWDKSEKRKYDFRDSIIRIIDFFEENGTSYIVLEYFCGITLDKYIMGNNLSIYSILGIFLKIAETVGEIHERDVIHCDIKPSNIMIDIEENIRIIDFGSSVEKGEKINFVKVSKGYSPIELYSEKIRIDERCDVYSLAGLLYFMLCSKKTDGVITKFYSPKLEFDRKIILSFEKLGDFKEIEGIIKKGLEFKRGDRFENVGKMVEKIKKFKNAAGEGGIQ